MTQLTHEDTLVHLPPVCTRCVDAGGQHQVRYTDNPEVSVDDFTDKQRHDLAECPSTDTDTLMALADDNSHTVRMSLTFNPNTPMVALLHLLDDGNSHVRSCAKTAFVLRGGDASSIEY